MQTQHNSRFSYFCLLVFIVCSSGLYGQQETPTATGTRKFEGLYIGVNTGIQSVFSEAIINELSVPQQNSRWTAEFFVAHRWQFLNDRVVFGLEVQIGLSDGNLERTYGVVPELRINFNNSNQAGLGYTLGYVAGRRQNLHLYTYLYQTRRNFNITFRNNERVLLWQTDIQTALRYGMGIEFNLGKQFSIRSAMGTQTPDLANNIDIDNAMELILGLTYQF